MKYRVLWDKEALYDLKRIDKTIAKKIVEKVSSYLVLILGNALLEI
jgi:mRNA-degrading endonuclease RelE of RelBE toxin-antitoxin system